jgi:hypothetical protein
MVSHLQWIWRGGSDQDKMKVAAKEHPSPEKARAAVDAKVKALLAAGWIEIPEWPKWPGEKAEIQPYPHPFRQRVQFSFSDCSEQSFELLGSEILHRQWHYAGGWTRKNEKKKRTTFASAKAAREALDQIVATLVADNWQALPDWPTLPADWWKGVEFKAASTRNPPTRPKRLAPVPLGKLTVVKGGKAKRATAAELAALTKVFGEMPKDWAKLVTTHGAQTFAKYVRFLDAGKIARTTSGWKKRVATGTRREHWVNYDQVVTDDKALCLIANTIDGDQIGYVGGRPKEMLILPRNFDEIIVLRGLPEVLGWYVATSEEQGGRMARTYGPER